MATTATLSVEASLSGAWSALTPDTLAGAGLTISYGISGSGPLDAVAGPGTCEFTLENWSTTGQYSPGHASAIAGWTIGTPIRVSLQPEIALTSAGGDAILSADGDPLMVGPSRKFCGTVASIAPEAGIYRTKRVRVTAVDYLGPLAETETRNISTQIGASEVACLQAVFDAVPAAVLPSVIRYDDAVDSYPYALDDVGAGASPLGLLKDIADSCFGTVTQHGDGDVVYQSRESRTFTASVDAFDDDDLDGLDATSAREQLWNAVRVEIPQFEVGGSPEVLASADATDTTGIPAGESIEVWLDYRDPNNTATGSTAIGGTDMITPPVATTDYLFNSASDGSGSNYTGSMTVTAEYFSGTVKYTITNGAAGTAYRTKLQARGTAIRRLAAYAVTSESTQDYGRRELRVAPRYQDDATVAGFIAEYVRSQYETVGNRPSSLTFNPRRSERLMRHMCEREPGDRITLTETVTGVDADAIIRSVAITVGAGPVFSCEWGLSPQASLMFITPWELGDATLTELGETTVLG